MRCYVYSWKIWHHINDFLSRSFVVVVMFLLPMRKVCIPSSERKMVVNKLLSVVKFLIQTIWVEYSQFWNPKVFRFFRSSCNSSVVLKVFVIFSIRANFRSLWKLWFEFWKCLQARIWFLFWLSFLLLFNLILKKVSLLSTYFNWQIRHCSK